MRVALRNGPQIKEVDEESVLDSDAAALKKKAEQEDICVPIGEGENCW